MAFLRSVMNDPDVHFVRTEPMVLDSSRSGVEVRWLEEVFGWTVSEVFFSLRAFCEELFSRSVSDGAGESAGGCFYGTVSEDR